MVKLNYYERCQKAKLKTKELLQKDVPEHLIADRIEDLFGFPPKWTLARIENIKQMQENNHQLVEQ